MNKPHIVKAMKQIVLCVSIFTSTLLSSQNLVLNPGFESGLSTWVPFASDTIIGKTQLDNTVAHTGSNSLRTVINNATKYITGAGVKWIQVKPGARYLLECFVKTNLANGQAIPYIQFLNNGVRQFGDGG